MKNSFSEQYTRIFEKIPVLDQGKAMRGLDDWGFTVKQRQAFRKVLNGAVNLTRFYPHLFPTQLLKGSKGFGGNLRGLFQHSALG